MTFRRIAINTALAAALGIVSMPTFAQDYVYGRTFRTESPTVRYEVVRTPQQIYVDETGYPYEVVVVNPARRADVIVVDGNGMTPADMSHITGNVDSNTAGMPMSGSGVQPGNMGPANSKGQ